MPFEPDATCIPKDYWKNYTSQKLIMDAVNEINAGRGFPLTVEKIIAFTRAHDGGWRDPFLDGLLPESIADYPISAEETVLAENAMAYGFSHAERLYGFGTA